MNNIFTILMIDDDKDNFDSLKNKAAEKGIILKYKESMEEMIEDLRKELKIDAVILDGKGFLKKGQIRGSEKENFVHEALTELRIIEKEQDRIIPKCVYTAWYDQLKDGLETRVKIFDKKKLALSDELMNEFFNYLIEEVNNSFSKKIKKKYHDVLTGIGDKYIPIEKELSTIQILTLVENNATIRQSHYNIIREILEAIFKRANVIDVNFIPNDLIKPDGRPNLEWCYRYLSGFQTDVKNASDVVIYTYPKKTPLVPAHISRCMDFVKQVSSMLSHDYNYKWSPLCFKACALALAEIIIWFKNYIDTNYPNI